MSKKSGTCLTAQHKKYRVCHHLKQLCHSLSSYMKYVFYIYEISYMKYSMYFTFLSARCVFNKAFQKSSCQNLLVQGRLYKVQIAYPMDKSHDFWRACCLFVARVVTFTPERSDCANVTTRATNKQYDLTKVVLLSLSPIYKDKRL